MKKGNYIFCCQYCGNLETELTEAIKHSEENKECKNSQIYGLLVIDKITITIERD